MLFLKIKYQGIRDESYIAVGKKILALHEIKRPFRLDCVFLILEKSLFYGFLKVHELFIHKNKDLFHLIKITN